MRRAVISFGFAIALVAGPGIIDPGAAQAQIVTYNSTGPPVFVSEGNGPDGDTSPITVPPGMPSVQTLEVTNLRIDWPASAQELSVEVISPDGQSVFLFEEGCFSYQPEDAWAYSDSAAQVGPNSKNDIKCDLPGGTFRPANTFPFVKKLSAFSGTPASGIWTLRAIDSGAVFINQGEIVSWALRIDHGPVPAVAGAAVAPAAVAAQRKKCKKGRKLKKGKCVKKKKK